MRKKIFFRLEFTFVAIVLLLSQIACVRKAAVPTTDLGTLTVEVTIPSPLSSDCSFDPNSLTSAANVGTNPEQWQVEFEIAGSTDGKPWFFTKKNQELTVTTSRGGLAFVIPGVPLKSGDFAVIAKLKTPCINGAATFRTCTTTSNLPWRNVIGTNQNVINPHLFIANNNVTVSLTTLSIEFVEGC
jgi:hypothetical protein